MKDIRTILSRLTEHGQIGIKAKEQDTEMNLGG